MRSVWNLSLVFHVIDYPGQCYIESEKRSYPVGSHSPLGVCYTIDCHSDLAATRRS